MSWPICFGMFQPDSAWSPFGSHRTRSGRVTRAA